MAPKISSAEWEIMSVVWERQPITATEVFEALPAGHDWKPKTVNTFLKRLVDKGVLQAEKKERAFVFTARIPREKCIRSESDSFLKRVFRGATGELVMHFCESAELSEAEIKELEEMLRAKKAKK